MSGKNPEENSHLIPLIPGSSEANDVSGYAVLRNKREKKETQNGLPVVKKEEVEEVANGVAKNSARILPFPKTPQIDDGGELEIAMNTISSTSKTPKDNKPKSAEESFLKLFNDLHHTKETTLNDLSTIINNSNLEEGRIVKYLNTFFENGTDKKNSTSVIIFSFLELISSEYILKNFSKLKYILSEIRTYNLELSEELNKIRFQDSSYWLSKLINFEGLDSGVVAEHIISYFSQSKISEGKLMDDFVTMLLKLKNDDQVAYILFELRNYDKKLTKRIEDKIKTIVEAENAPTLAVSIGDLESKAFQDKFEDVLAEVAAFLETESPVSGQKKAVSGESPEFDDLVGDLDTAVSFLDSSSGDSVVVEDGLHSDSNDVEVKDTSSQSGEHVAVISVSDNENVGKGVVAEESVEQIADSSCVTSENPSLYGLDIFIPPVKRPKKSFFSSVKDFGERHKNKAIVALIAVASVFGAYKYFKGPENKPAVETAENNNDENVINPISDKPVENNTVIAKVDDVSNVNNASSLSTVDSKKPSLFSRLGSKIKGAKEKIKDVSSSWFSAFSKKVADASENSNNNTDAVEADVVSNSEWTYVAQKRDEHGMRDHATLLGAKFKYATNFNELADKYPELFGKVLTPRAKYLIDKFFGAMVVDKYNKIHDINRSIDEVIAGDEYSLSIEDVFEKLWIVRGGERKEALFKKLLHEEKYAELDAMIASGKLKLRLNKKGYEEIMAMTDSRRDSKTSENTTTIPEFVTESGVEARQDKNGNYVVRIPKKVTAQKIFSEIDESGISEYVEDAFDGIRADNVFPGLNANEVDAAFDSILKTSDAEPVKSDEIKLKAADFRNRVNASLENRERNNIEERDRVRKEISDFRRRIGMTVSA